MIQDKADPITNYTTLTYHFVILLVVGVAIWWYETRRGTHVRRNVRETNYFVAPK